MSLLARVTKAFAWNQGGQLATFGLRTVLSIVLARGLGAAQYGDYSLVLSVVGLVSLLGAVGLEETANTFVPKMYTSAGERSYLLRVLLGIRSLLTTILCVFLGLGATVIALMVAHLELAELLPYSVPFAFLSGVVPLLSIILIAQFRVRLVTIAQTLALALRIALSGLALWLGLGIKGLLIASAVVLLLPLVVFVRELLPDLSHRPISTDLNRTRRFALTVWFNGLAGYVIGNQSDVMLLGFFLADSKDIGYYSIAYNLGYVFFSLLISGLQGVGLAAFAETYAKQGLQRLVTAWETVIRFQTLMTVPVAVFVIWAAQPMIRLMYSEEYAPATLLFQVFTLLILTSRILGGGTHQTVLYVLSKESWVLAIRVAWSIVNIVLALVLISRFGAIGAIVATGAVWIAIVVTEWMVARRFMPIRYPWRFVAKVFAACLVGLAVISWIQPLDIQSCILGGLIYSVSCVAVLKMAKPLSAQDVRSVQSIDSRLERVAAYFH